LSTKIRRAQPTTNGGVAGTWKEPAADGNAPQGFSASVDDAILSRSLDGVIITWNSGAERLYGYSEQEALGRDGSFLIPPELSDELPDILERIRSGEHIENYETMRLAKDGRRLHVSMTISPQRDAQGTIIEALTNERSATERAHTEEVLGARNTTLEGQVAEGTRALRASESQVAKGTRALRASEGQVAKGTRALRASEGQVAEGTRALRASEGQVARGTVALRLSEEQVAEGARALIASALDISERTRAGKALGELNATLEGQVAEGARALIASALDISERTRAGIALDARNLSLEGQVAEGTRLLRASALDVTQRRRAGEALGALNVSLKGQVAEGARALLASARDVTERTRAGEALGALNVTLAEQVAEGALALLASEERLRVLAEDAQDLIFRTVLLPQQHCEYASPSHTTILGYTPAEFYADGQLFSKRVHPEDLTLFLPAPSQMAANSTFRWIRKDGAVIWLEAKNTQIHDEDGNIVAVEGIIREVTERKRAEGEIRSLNESLERRILERTAQLEEAKDEAERANRAKNEFLSRMSHELRTPLNAIIGFAKLMQMDERNPEDDESLQLILRGGKHLLELINEVLDIARIDTGRLTLSLEPVELGRTVREAIALAQPLAAGRKIRIASPDSAAECLVLADQQRLNQVMLNLLSNAIKYNQVEGSIVVQWDRTPAGRLRVTVADTGVGIHSDVMDRLFTPFDRLGAERTDIEGTGLGLALSKGLVEAMNGTIGATSSVGKGSTFWVDLASAESREAELEAAESETDDAGSLATPPTRTILYVEDNPSNFRLIERVLKRRPGFKLLAAMQGGIGIELAREHLPDLILLDIHLPDMGGDEVLRHLKADPQTSAIPVVALSADATRRQIDITMAGGAKDFLTKPLDIERFLTLVDEIMDKVP
jgi:PAS domain S-box-containing protein